MDRVIAFDLWGQYAHYKKIFATTTALTYPIPVKTALYGMVGAIIGLEKTNNQYLKYFQTGDCLIGIQVMRPLVLQRININLRAVFGPMKLTDNRKPTLMEFVYQPRYRIFFAHRDQMLADDLKQCLQNKQCIYTPTLGLANLLANFQWVGEWPMERRKSDLPVPIHSVIPKRKLIKLDTLNIFERGNRVFEVSQYALEMDQERNVLERDDIILDQNGIPIYATVSEYIPIASDQKTEHVILF